MQAAYDVVCFGHERWDLASDRSRRLLVRCAASHRVFYVEEAVTGPSPARLAIARRAGGIRVITPRLPAGLADEQAAAVVQGLLAALFAELQIVDFVLWYYAASALAYSRHLRPLALVYDCDDRLCPAVWNAPPAVAREKELLAAADLVFTGTQQLYDLRRRRHCNVYYFPADDPAQPATGDRATWESMRSLLDSVVEARRAAVLELQTLRAARQDDAKARRSSSRSRGGRVLAFPNARGARRRVEGSDGE
jgi:hypothetical protein